MVRRDGARFGCRCVPGSGAVRRDPENRCSSCNLQVRALLIERFREVRVAIRVAGADISMDIRLKGLTSPTTLVIYYNNNINTWIESVYSTEPEVLLRKQNSMNWGKRSIPESRCSTSKSRLLTTSWPDCLLAVCGRASFGAQLVQAHVPEAERHGVEAAPLPRGGCRGRSQGPSR